jgi:hypothetical protein
MRWLGVLLLLLLPGLAAADTFTLTWDPFPGATSYDVLRSTDFNPATAAGTWSVLGNVLSTACVGTPAQCPFTDGAAPATGAAYYRITPKNASGGLILMKKGLYYCPTCPEPGPPTKTNQSLGTQP